MLKDVSFASGRSHSTRGRPRSQRRLASVCQLTSQPPDVARAHEEQQVPVDNDLGEPAPDAFEVRAEDRLRHHLGELARAQTVRIRLPGRINLAHDQLVRTFQAAGELTHQRPQAREAMRLEDEHEPAAGQFASGRDRRQYLGWMVAVVVVDLGAAKAAYAL